jgi:hypothetical protein
MNSSTSDLQDYEPRGILDAADRYHFNGTTAVRNADGTVTFRFKQTCEPQDANCLDVPAGRFDVAARYYLSRREIASGAWRFPPITLAAE